MPRVTGCVRRLGYLVLLAALAAAAWFFRDRLLPRRGGGAAARADTVVWEPLTSDRASRGRETVQRLAQSSGPAFVSLGGGELASYLFLALARDLPASTDSAEAAVIGEGLFVRGSVRLADLGGAAILGPLASMLRERERLLFGGGFEIVRPGLAQFHLTEVKVGQLSLPKRMIPVLVPRIGRGRRPEGVAPDALPLMVPPYIGDVRIARGRVTLYRSATQ